jgi:hypothetical protein
MRAINGRSIGGLPKNLTTDTRWLELLANHKAAELVEDGRFVYVSRPTLGDR